MRGLREEILEIPLRAEECYELNKLIVLPLRVPYLGMGSSYFAALAAYYAGANIQPELASEYFHYLSTETLPTGVLISQSGETSEILWNLKKFDEVIAISNTKNSTLARAKETQTLVELYAGKEEFFSSTKTYINTLVTLYAGLGIDPKKAITILKAGFKKMDDDAKEKADKVSQYLKKTATRGYYVLGSGPNLATAYHASLVLSETTKLPWTGMTVSQYDHGPKEVSESSIILFMNGGGKSAKRIEYLKKLLADKTSACVLEFRESELSETLSPLALATRVCLFMDHLADDLGAKNTFHIGKKVTTVPDSAR